MAISAFPHIHSGHLLSWIANCAGYTISKGARAVWSAIASMGVPHDMTLDELERYMEKAQSPEDEARRLRTWDEHVGRMRGWPPRH